jgi:hypothetical protein
MNYTHSHSGGGSQYLQGTSLAHQHQRAQPFNRASAYQNNYEINLNDLGLSYNSGPQGRSRQPANNYQIRTSQVNNSTLPPGSRYNNYPNENLLQT